MEHQGSAASISVVWRGKKYVVEMNSNATLQEFGNELRKLTNARADTMRLIVPQSSEKSSKLLSPYSDEHAPLSLQETSILYAKSIRMMGASEVEIEEIVKKAKEDQRIAGFGEEEKRMKQRMGVGPHNSLKLPQGNYIFCDFRTLQLPGIELNPPPSEALKRMHMLAADPGIVAIMNKHRWRVGIMTEMAPIGYVGVSPKCILGFNKNQGEEISLRLRTDDLKGFRKYESIKKTLLHELAHMVYSEHDANFYALDKLLNQEAASLDWTRSGSHTLNGFRHSKREEEEFDFGESSRMSQKLGGKTLHELASARASSVAAAYTRLAKDSTNNSKASDAREEPEPDGHGFNLHGESDLMDTVEQEKLIIEGLIQAQLEGNHEPDPEDSSGNHNLDEPDPDEYDGGDTMESEAFSETNGTRITSELSSKDIEMIQAFPMLASARMPEKPYHNESEKSLKHGVMSEAIPDHSQAMGALGSGFQPRNTIGEPDPEDSEAQVNNLGMKTPQSKAYREPDPDDSQVNVIVHGEPDPDDSLVNVIVHGEPDPDDSLVNVIVHGEPDPDDQELRRIQDPVSVFCNRIKNAIDMLRSEVNPTETTTVLQTLFKIIRNVMEHPNEMKFKKLRKANPVIQRNVANYKAAMEFLFLIGFNEDVVLDEIGKTETYLVLKRNDPGLLWLAKSSLETCIAY